MPPSRTRTLSKRNVRGWGSMKGNLQEGCMWLNVKRAFFGPAVFSRGFRYNEKLTLEELYDEIVHDVQKEHADWYLPEDWCIDVQFKRGKSLGDERYKDDIVKDHFLGAETLHVKVFDDEKDRRTWDDYEGWIYLVPGARRELWNSKTLCKCHRENQHLSKLSKLPLVMGLSFRP